MLKTNLRNLWIQSQLLEIVSEAWDKKDYAVFIKAVDKIDITQYFSRID